MMKDRPVKQIQEKTEDTNTETEEGNEEESSGEQVLKIANDQEPQELDPHITPAHSSVQCFIQKFTVR